MDPLNISAWASKRFDASLRKHKSILSKVASWARDKLRALIERNMDESPLVVALAIKRFSCALDLTDNHSILKSGTDAVLSKLKRNLFHVQESLGFIEDQSRTNVDKIPSSMIKCKQILFGINGVIACCKEFGVHDTINELLSECETITDSCQQIERMLFQTWAQNAIDGIDSGDLPLRTNEKIIDTDKRGMLQVSCDQSLTFLSRDERKYTELGFSIPKTIHSVVGGMEKPLYIATILCKITSFYNSLEHHIIPSQRSMLLDSLMSFENVLQSQAGISKSSKGTRSKSDSIKCKVTWDNMYECECFVEKIHKALDNLKDEIGELRSSHNNLTKKMLFLTSLDLLTQKKEWMDQWKNVEKSLKDTCQKYSPQLTSKWVTYWDKRVYDALDSSYRRGLPMLHEHVGSFSCELTITSGTISFHPDLSSLKSTFISRVSAFIDFPGSKFKGLNNSDMFGTIKTNHVGLSRESMKDANQLIKRLEEFPQKYSTWLSIFAFDDTASSFSDFNKCHNFIDQIQQDLANLPDYEMVGCITLSLTKFNRQLRCEAERCRDCLRENLTNSVATQCKDIENYLESSVVVLKQIPTTLAELAQSQKYWKQVVENKSSFQSKVIDCKKKLDLNNEYGLIDTTGLSERVTVLENFQVS